ncbi:MAG: dUTP diphosphatase [Candidatus Obscuribacter sp.]|nr:dUTP diphosphatase [Candidatus Obscuribacter sp.]
MEDLVLRIKRLPHCRGLPFYASPEAAGLDLTAGIEQPIRLQPMNRIALPTGIIVEVPPGYEGQIRARSGLAATAGISLTNCVGTIDSDYRGELMVLLINFGDQPYVIEPGERIAQLVIAPLIRVKLVETDELSAGGSRGVKGFGSTGKAPSPEEDSEM